MDIHVYSEQQPKKTTFCDARNMKDRITVNTCAHIDWPCHYVQNVIAKVICPDGETLLQLSFMNWTSIRKDIAESLQTATRAVADFQFRNGSHGSSNINQPACSDYIRV